MAETKRMTCEQVVGYLLEGEGLDFLRESLSWVVQQLMEAEVSELVGAARGERAPACVSGTTANEALMRSSDSIAPSSPACLDRAATGAATCRDRRLTQFGNDLRV